MLQTSIAGIDFDTNTTVHITFMITADKQIVVLSTNSNDLDSLIKTSLNYKEIAAVNLQVDKKYTVPVTFKS